MNKEIQIGQMWQHFKGNHYKIIGVGKHTETGEEFVAYQDMIDGKIWFRPKAMFLENVTRDGKTFPRFALLA